MTHDSEPTTDISRYDRQWRIPQIGKEGQARLAKACVAVVGLGALGSVSAGLLARAGVGRLILIDRDFPELTNLQRQTLYDEEDLKLNLPKAVIASRKLAAANRDIQIEPHAADLNSSTIDELLGPADLIVDGADNYETRYLLNDYALKNKKIWIYGGVIRTEGISAVIVPGDGPCLRCLFAEAPPAEERETCDQAGVLAAAAHVTASFQAAEAIKWFVSGPAAVDRRLWRMDLWNKTFHAVPLQSMPMSCEGCLNGIYPYLESDSMMETVKMCGRNAVQIYSRQSTKIDFKKMAEKLAGQVSVEYNDYILSIHPEPFEIMVFANGRAIVKGTEDAAQAKSLYARFIGS